MTDSSNNNSTATNPPCSLPSPSPSLSTFVCIIITALALNLHPWLPLEYVASDLIGCDDTYLESRDYIFYLQHVILASVLNEFFIDFFLDPEALNEKYSIVLTKEQSRRCGRVSADDGFYCYGKDSGVLLAEVWKQFWIAKKEDAITLLLEFEGSVFDRDSAGNLVDTYAKCLGEQDGDNQALFKYKDYVGMVEDFTGKYDAEAIRPTGPGFCDPYLHNTVRSNVLWPANWIVNNKEKFNTIITRYSGVTTNLYWAFSDITKQAQSNGVVSVSDGYREAGVMGFYDGKWGR